MSKCIVELIKETLTEVVLVLYQSSLSFLSLCIATPLHCI